MLKRAFKKNSHNPVFKVLAGLGRSMNRLYENRNHDIYSNGEMMVLEKLSKFKPEVIIDGGANVGNYALLAKSVLPDCHVYSFEPVKDTFDKLATNLKGQTKTSLINKGLYSENCTKTINLFSSNEHSSIYDIHSMSNIPTRTTNIELVKGDDFLKEKGIEEVDFLKLDLEGAEYDALKGFENSLKEGKIKMIQFEYGYINITTKKLLIDFYQLLEPYNYLLGKVFPKNVEFRKYQYKYEDFLGPNFVAVRKDETALIELLKKK